MQFLTFVSALSPKSDTLRLPRVSSNKFSGCPQRQKQKECVCKQLSDAIIYQVTKLGKNRNDDLGDEMACF